MFDIGWSEMAVIALIALVVIGPKELPNAMRSVAKWVRKARSMAREFQSGMDDMIREADLEDARKAIDATKTFNLDKAVEDTIDPTGSLREEAGELEDTMRRTEPDESGAETAEAGASEPPEASTPDGPGAETAGETEPGGATVVKTPVNIAPPHSLTPPPEEEAAPSTEEAVASDSDGSHQRA